MESVWFARLIIALIGLGLVFWGRSHGRTPHVVAGIIMIATPWLFPSVGPLLGFMVGVVMSLLVVSKFGRA